MAVTAALLAVGAVGLWNHSRGNSEARILLLDPATGRTLHEHVVPGGYAVVAILSDGRVAVASEAGCPDDRVARITLLDRSLERVLSSHDVSPCAVARMDSAQLTRRFQASPGPLPRYDGTTGVTVRMGGGEIVETYERTPAGLYWLHVLTARDRSGRVTWRRTLHHVGVVDARNGVLVAPLFGEFTPGSD
jgi:hypothetical protein